MTNAGNYTDTTDTDFKGASYNIDTGKSLSAEGMRNALHTKEKVANKQVDSTDTAGTLTSSSSDSYYPSSKLVGKNLDALNTTLSTMNTTINTSLSGKQDKIDAGIAKNIVAYSGTAGTFDTLTRAATTMETSTASASDDKIPTEKAVAAALASSISALGLSGKEDASNKVTSIDAANQNDTAKYPTTGAVAALVSAELATVIDLVLPKGTIIAMHNTYYYNSASEAFKNKWAVCNGTNNTPDLRDLFLRGANEGGTAAVGSDSVTLAAANLPEHTHSVSITEPNEGKGHRHPAMQQHYSGQGNSCLSGGADTTPHNNDWWYSTGYAKTEIAVSVTGGGGSPQTAVAIVPKYYAVIYVMKVN
ncbi:MAG: hypothetical protein LBK68_06785 [Candidatus Margulisbacteria bacterium]|nr:hypothetical protein [Candidatus Margulisiibacteriota bacterium]